MRNSPLIITVVIALAGFAYGMNNMISPEMYRSINPPELGYIFVPDDDTFVESEHRLEIEFVEFGPEREKPVSATAHIARKVNDPMIELPFEPLFFNGQPTRTWFAVLPPLSEKGSRWFYYITIKTSNGRVIEIWKSKNWFEKLFSGFRSNRQYFWVTYEGNVSREMPGGKLALIFHIVLTFGALLLLFHTLYYSLWLIKSPSDNNMRKAYKSALWAIICFTIGAIIIGIPITRYTFDVGFAPWPVKGLTNPGDITDTKSTLLVIWWLILLITNRHALPSAKLNDTRFEKQRRFGWLTILALLVTIFVFLIPHSQFMQSGS